MLADPHTLVLDEATSLIDPRAARHLERSLAAVLEGRTVIAIAHRLFSAHDADRVAVVEDGRITELGSHDELVAAGGSYAALWRLLARPRLTPTRRLFTAQHADRSRVQALRRRHRRALTTGRRSSDDHTQRVGVHGSGHTGCGPSRATFQCALNMKQGRSGEDVPVAEPAGTATTAVAVARQPLRRCHPGRRKLRLMTRS